jgi:tyrosyl-tRNA synthetase
VTRLAHGEEEARKAEEASLALFGSGGDSELIPVAEVPSARVRAGIDLGELMHEIGLVHSNSEARRLISQGGVYVNDERVIDRFRQVSLDDASDGRIVIRKGKKAYRVIKVV